MLNFFKSKLFFLFLITAAVFITYGKAINYDYTKLDDDALTYKRVAYISDYKNIFKYFLTDCYASKLTQYYRPILNMSFISETLIFGINSKVYHLSNIILFILCLYLMYLFALKFKINDTVLKAVVLIASVHPVLSSVPVWLPARNDILLTIFLMISFINFINYLKTDKTIYFVIHFISFAFALFTKESALVMLAIYPLIIYCLNLQINKKQLLKNIIFVTVLVIIYFILRHFAVRGVDISLYFKNFVPYIKNITLGLLQHIYCSLLPDYVPVIIYDMEFSYRLVLPILVFILLIIACIKNLLDKKIFILSCIFISISLFTTFLQEDYYFLNHRFMLSMAGMILIFGNLFTNILKVKPELKKYFILLLCILIPSFSFISNGYADRFEDEESFWSNMYNDAPNYAKACHALASLFLDEEKLEEAKFFINKALDLHKDNIRYIIDAVTIDFVIYKNLELAEKNYIEISKHSNTDEHKSFCLAQIAKIYFLKDDLPKAIEYAEKALELLPYDMEALSCLAGCYATNKDFDKAEKIYKKLLKANPKNQDYIDLLKTLEEDRKEFESQKG